MIKNNVLIVGGDFNNFGGRSSGYVTKLSTGITDKGYNCQVINGGAFADLQALYNTNALNEVDFVVWMPNIPNDYPKLCDVKNINPKLILITSKRNNSEYSYKELVSRALAKKANLMLVVNSENKNNIVTEIIDPLGNSFGKSNKIDDVVSILVNRMQFLRGMERKSTEGHCIEEAFLDIVRNSGKIFHNLMGIDTARFLGNSSFRCIYGFPSQRIGTEMILVSKRNVSKDSISKDDFILTWMDGENKVHYIGDVKPSVDTPVQLSVYKRFPEINYMIHSHCYVENAPFTKSRIPCGAMQEAEEIGRIYTETGKSVINLLGHGSIVLAKTLKDFTSVQYYARPMPESVETDSNEKAET